MTRRLLAVLVAIVTATLCGAPVAVADPATDTSCTPALEGVTTKKLEADVVMLCRDGMWYPQPADAPPSNRWVSWGPTLTLRGEALPNPNINMGRWLARPLGEWTRCRSLQQTGVAAGAVSKPIADQGSIDVPMLFDIVTNAVTVHFSGYCLWTLQP
jgi:hypothetical protein